MQQAVRSETRHKGRDLLAVPAAGRHPGEVPSCLTGRSQSFGRCQGDSTTTRDRAPHGQACVRRRSVKHSEHHGKASGPPQRSGKPSQMPTGGGSTLHADPSSTGSEAREGSGTHASPWATIWSSPSTSSPAGRGWPASSRSGGSRSTGPVSTTWGGRGGGEPSTRAQRYSCPLPRISDPPRGPPTASQPAVPRCPALDDGSRLRRLSYLPEAPSGALPARSFRARP